MRLKSWILCSSSVAAAMVLASPALAQQPPAPEGDNQEAQTQPADPEAEASVQADDPVQDAAGGDEVTEGEEVVVTGLRRSLRSAQNVKRNSEQIVDTIVAEDIGKLPDIAVSDTAARIPGVQVVRRGGEADTVLIRGLPDFSTTYNGREIFTAERREVALQDFPSSNIAALEVFKTTTADLVEAGLAGQVNVRSRRPFDFRNRELAGSVWGLYTRQAEGFTPNFNLLATDRWDTGIGEIGALINVSYTQLKFLDSEPSNTDFLADPTINGQQVRFPDIQRLFFNEGDRSRPSVNVAFQWRPSDTLELYAEGLYQGYLEKESDRLVEVPLFGGQSYSNLVTRPGTNLLSSGTVVGPGNRIFTFQGASRRETDTYQFAVGGRYETGPLRITADLAMTDSTFSGSVASFDRTFNGTPTIDFNLDVPEFAIRNFDPFNPANYNFDGFYEEAQEASGDDIQARVDAEYELDVAFLRNVQLGVRYTTRDAHREFGNRFAGYRPQNINATTVPGVRFARTNPGFRGTDVQSDFRSFLSPTYDSLRRSRRDLRQFVINTPRSFGFGTFTLDDVDPNPDSVYDAQEDTLAGYAQLEYAFGETIDGTVGIRVARTETDIDGTSIIEGVATPVSGSGRFTDYLPNASIRWRITPELQFRASATQTRTRPTFAQLNPSATLGPPGNQINPTDPFANARRGSSGNPNLRALESDNYDLSLEYYFARNGFVALAGFRRDLSNFITNTEFRTVDPVLGPIIVNRPVNLNEGRLQGVEAQAQGFFDFDFLPNWARGFGAQANVTFIDNKGGDAPAGTDGLGLDRLPGISKWTYNLAGFYEAGGLSARLSYNKRSKVLDFASNRGDDIFIQEAKFQDRLDLSTSYTLFENLTVFFDWTNILGDPSRFNFSSARAGAPRADFIRFLRFEESTFSGGIRFRL